MRELISLSTVRYRAVAVDNITYVARRLRVDKLSQDRPGSDFHVQELPAEKASGFVGFHSSPALRFERGAFVIPQDTTTVEVMWK